MLHIRPRSQRLSSPFHGRTRDRNPGGMVHHPVRPGNEPVIVTLTIKTPLKAEPATEEDASFIAAWGYGGEGLALDLGKCVLSR